MATQAERREATRDAIIAAATRLFGENGFDATRVDDIATAAGVAKGAVYHHFPTKESVFEAVFNAVSAGFANETINRARKTTDPLDAIVIGARDYIETCSVGETGQIILKDGPNILGWKRWRDLDQLYFGATIPRAIELSIKRGLIAEQPPEPLSRLLVGAITEAAMACAVSENPSREGRRHIRALRTMLEGLRTG